MTVIRFEPAPHSPSPTVLPAPKSRRDAQIDSINARLPRLDGEQLQIVEIFVAALIRGAL